MWGMKFMKIKFILLALVLILMVSCSDFVANTTSSAQILSIGLNYKGTEISSLDGTINDCTEMGIALDEIMNKKGISRSLTFMTQTADSDKKSEDYPTQSNILNKIDAYELNPSDCLYVYYSGHGQAVWYAKCPKCGTEVVKFYDGHEELKKPELTCYYCNNSVSLLEDLLALLYGSSQYQEQTKNYLTHVITGSDYIDFLKEHLDSTYVAETLKLVDYFSNDVQIVTRNGEQYVQLNTNLPDLQEEYRGFLVTAPEKTKQDFEDYFSNLSAEQTIIGQIVRLYQASSQSLADFSNTSDYYNYLLARLPNSYKAVFDRYWNIYVQECLNKTNYSQLYMEELVDRLNKFDCTVVLIVDACFSGIAGSEKNEALNENIFSAFKNFMKKGKYSNLTVVMASSPVQTSMDSTIITEDGYTESHGLFTSMFLNQLGWTHSTTSYYTKLINQKLVKINGSLGDITERKTVRQVFDKVMETWATTSQTPYMNETYMDAVIVP